MKNYNLQKMQELLQHFYNLTSIKICIYDNAENELCFYPEKFSPFCALLRTDPEMNERCKACDQRAFSECKKTREQYTYTCHAGLWECVYACIGEKLISPKGESFGLEIMKKLNEYCNKWTREDNIGYSVYGTPLESTTYKFAKCLKKRFGVIKGVTDKDYITNSYHIHVSEPVDAFTKLSFESKFQNLSSGGAISYVEVPNMQNNIPAVL